MLQRAFWRQATLAFSAGALGALFNRAALVAMGAIGIIGAPVVSKEWLYQALVWGGLWGFLFLIPWRSHWLVRALVFGIGPSLGVWLVLFPYVWHMGFFGLSGGPLSIVVPLIANGAWGVAAGGWLEFVGAGERALSAGGGVTRSSAAR